MTPDDYRIEKVFGFYAINAIFMVQDREYSAMASYHFTEEEAEKQLKELKDGISNSVGPDSPGSDSRGGDRDQDNTIKGTVRR